MMKTAEDVKSERLCQGKATGKADLMRFFNALSERAYKENDLSDVTYAMCEACIKFKQYFLDFFFQDVCLDAREVEFEREHLYFVNLDNSRLRPDFWIQTSKGVFIVEVKIWDGNHHFEDYSNLLLEKNKSSVAEAWKHLGYIANYSSVKKVSVAGKMAKDCCRVATWKEFIEGLERYAYYDDPVIIAYVEYVRRVCPFDDLYEDFEVDDKWTIETDDFKAIKQFEGDLKKAISDVGCELYESYGMSCRFCSQQKMGQFFKWKIDGKGELAGKTVQGWIGVYYRKGGAVFCVEFKDRDGWGHDVCACYEKHVKFGMLRFFARNSVQVVKGAEGIKAFLEVVLNVVQNINSLRDDNTDFCLDIKEVCENNLVRSLLAMRCLPFVIMNDLVTDEFKQDMLKKGYEFSIGKRIGDEEVPESHCGCYFELKWRMSGDDSKKDCEQEMVPACRGWIGVNYNNSCKRLSESDGSDKGRQSFGERPAFIVAIAKDFPAVNEFEENSWGWKFREIEMPSIHAKAMELVRKQLLAMCDAG